MRVLLIIFAISLLTSCYHEERNCSDFKTGTFEFETYVDGELKKTKFIRNDSLEIEIYENKVDTASIRWVNDCEYILKALNPKNRSDRQQIRIKILNTNQNDYTFQYNVVGKDETQQGRVTKVED